MCDCIAKIDEHLSQYNTKLNAALGVIDGQIYLLGVKIETYKINTKQRGPAKKVVATYCPFCGEKYNVPETKDSHDR